VVWHSDAKYMNMSSAHNPAREPSVGEEVTLLVHTDDRPIWTMGRISNASPFQIEIEPAHLQPIRNQKNLLVLHDSGRKYSKGEGKVGKIDEKNGKAWLTFSEFRWEPVDNRDNPRFEVELQSIVRSINEHDGAIVADEQVGLTKNLSIGGVLLEVSSPLAKGQLVEFRVTLDGGTTIRTMGVVAHSKPDEDLVGISFLDFVGAARYNLHQFLRTLAA